MVKSAIIFLLNSSWGARNMARFNSGTPSLHFTISKIMSQVAMSGNHSLLPSSSSMHDFKIIKDFKVNIHPPRAPLIKEVIWNPPILDCLKCNCDGAFTQDPPTFGCGGIFRNSKSDFLFAFPEPTLGNLPFLLDF